MWLSISTTHSRRMFASSHPTDTACSIFSSLSSSFATRVPRLTLPSIRALLATTLFPPVNSLIFARMKGVLSLPDAPAEVASLIASSMMPSISDLATEASAGIGFASSKPDERERAW